MRKSKKKLIRVACLLLVALLLLLLLPSCSVSIGDNSQNKEETERAAGIKKILQSAVLQYPEKNSEFFYEIYDTHVMITKYLGEGGEVVIPSKIKDLPVYVISASAFKGTGVTKVTIEEGIYKIGERCFQGCEFLQSVKLPDSLSVIEQYTFAECPALESIVFPKRITAIPDFVCSDCTSLKTVKILTETAGSSIGTMSFIRCTSLESVFMTNSIETIKPDAFIDASETAVFYGPPMSAAAEYSAKNFFEYIVVQDEQEVPVETGVSTETNDAGSTEHKKEDGGSVVGLIIVAIVFFGLLGGVIAFVFIKRRRRY